MSNKHTHHFCLDTAVVPHDNLELEAREIFAYCECGLELSEKEILHFINGIPDAVAGQLLFDLYKQLKWWSWHFVEALGDKELPTRARRLMLEAPPFILSDKAPSK